MIHLETISQVYRQFKQGSPKHPLISLQFHHNATYDPGNFNKRFSMNLYVIMFKSGMEGALGYGRSSYDFQDGTMIFMAPNQVFSFDHSDTPPCAESWTLMFHPDILRKSKLGDQMSQYSFFSYSANEALHLSDEEKKGILELAQKIQNEYNQNIDKHTQELIIINLESILTYCSRYYDRQFYTRANYHKDYLTKFEQFLKNHFSSGALTRKGIPSVSQIGEAFNMSGYYLSDLLKSETGKSAKEHIHLFLVDKAKTVLLNTNNSISEIAYDLGFEYPQHFSKLFKSKTGFSPSQYRTLN